MLILDLRLLLANIAEKKHNVTQASIERLLAPTSVQRPVFTSSLDQVVAPLLDRVPSRQNDGGGESDYVFTSLMLAAQTLSKWLDGVELLLIYLIISWVYTCLYICL